MMEKIFIQITAFLCSICFAQALSQERRPNVIVIVSDDAGYADFGCYGGKEIPTPQIDSLAKNGTLFTDAYVTASICAPSRAGLLTGMYQQRFGFEHNTSSKPAKGYSLTDVGMDPGIHTIADQMKANGYKTIAIGKWHQGDEEKHFPLNRGFDEFYGFVGGHRSFFGYKDKAPSKIHALYHNRDIVPESEISYTTDMFTDKAISYIKENSRQPFFMYLAYNAVHVPMNAKKELIARFPNITDPGRKAYAAMMTSLDDGIGKLVQTLKQQGIYEETLVVFINDNGAATGNYADNGKLRGLKGSKWEGGIRVACIMQWPNRIPAGKVYRHPVSSLDIMPTAVAAAGGKLIVGQITDGKNLIPYLNGQIKKAPNEDLFWRRGTAAAIRSGDWKLIRAGENPLLLFNLKKDISETQNLASSKSSITRKLLRKLETWERQMDQPHWTSDYGNYNQIMKHRMDVIGREMELKYP